MPSSIPDHEQKIRDRFARETAGHEMAVLHDDGLYRHLRFTNPQYGGIYSFDLITWPGALAIRGDINEAYVFTRLTDMFEFFRSKRRRINPHYWSEKLDGDRARTQAYSMDLFDEEVARELKVAEEDYPGITAAWNAHVEAEFNTEYEDEARRALDEFEFGEAYKAHCSECGWQAGADDRTDAIRQAVRHRRDFGDMHVTSIENLAFTFTDTCEWDLRDFDWSFLWACHAIVDGIRRYDKVRAYGLSGLATQGGAR